MATKMKLEDWLDDLCVRFIINLPQADLVSMARICFQVEEAHWFYDDFIRPLDRSLPPMTLRTFCLAIFKRCPLLAPFPIENHILAFEEFLRYKTSIPVRGAILLNEAMDMALLVKGWKKGANWSFPKGKINMDEDDLDCAVREVDEETGFDIRAAGLVPPPEDVKYIEATFRDQQIRLYVFRNVPMDTRFEPKTRKEIGGIQWYKIDDLPSYRKKHNNPANGSHGYDVDYASNNSANNKFYMVAQFMGQLKKWIAQQRKKDAIRAGKDYLIPQIALAEDAFTEDEGNPLPEVAPGPPSGTTGDPNQILANASRELRKVLQMPPPPADQPATDAAAPAFVDPDQNRANALLAILQKGGSITSQAAAPTPPAGNQGMSLNHLLAKVSQSNVQPPPPPPHQYYPQQQPPLQPPQHQQQPQQEQPATFQKPIPIHGPSPMQGQQHPPEYGQYAAPHLSPQQQQMMRQHQGHAQQQAYNKAQLAQQNQHLQQRFQLQQPAHGQQPPLNHAFPGQQQQQPAQGQNVNPFAPNPNPHNQPPPPYTANGNNPPGPPQSQAQAHAQAQAAAAAFRSQQHPPPPIPLLHPQPLPPIVQKNLFSRELLVSPDVAAHQNNMMMPPPPLLLEQYQQGQRPPLSNHAASLLSVFKKKDEAVPQAGAVPQAAAGVPVAAAAPGWQQRPALSNHATNLLNALKQKSDTAAPPGGAPIGGAPIGIAPGGAPVGDPAAAPAVGAPGWPQRPALNQHTTMLLNALKQKNTNGLPGSSATAPPPVAVAPPGHGVPAMDPLVTAAPDGLPAGVSRSGNPTPMSPANRDFLLSYLASMSGTK